MTPVVISPLPRMHRLAARIITELTTPALVNIVVPLIIGYHSNSVAWGATVSISAGAVPFAGILGGMYARRVTDHHVTVRAERPVVMAFILCSLGVGLVAQLVWSAPSSIVALSAAMLATLLVLAAFTIRFRWKVSVHAAVAAGSVAMLAEAMGSWWWLGLIAVPVVMWSRVQLEDHNAGQVYAGALTGLFVAGLVFGGLT